MPNLLLNNCALEQIITNTVDGVKQYIQAKEDSIDYDFGYNEARKFISEYRHCLFNGNATEVFIDRFLFYAAGTLRDRKLQKAKDHRVYAIGSAGLIALGLSYNSLVIEISGIFLFGYSMIRSQLIARSLQRDLNQLKTIIDNPEQINNALQQLYKKGK